MRITYSALATDLQSVANIKAICNRRYFLDG